jgi:hypothetical protein
MSAFRKLLVTALLAWTLIIGPLLAIAAGITLLSSVSPMLAKRSEIKGNGRSGEIAETVEQPTDRDPIGIRQNLEFLATTLALLKPVPVVVPAGENASAYARDAISWQFGSDACKTVVDIKQVLLGIVVAECESGERFLLIATAVTGKRSVVRCTALPRELVEAAPGCR